MGNLTGILHGRPGAGVIADRVGPSTLQRAAALILAVVVIPSVMVLSSALQDAPIRLGAASPRTVVAPDLIRVDDPEATEVARAAAAEAVAPVLV
jgi:membrane-associated HD superfamily phosphohydrolase